MGIEVWPLALEDNVKLLDHAQNLIFEEVRGEKYEEIQDTWDIPVPVTLLPSYTRKQKILEIWKDLALPAETLYQAYINARKKLEGFCKFETFFSMMPIAEALHRDRQRLLELCCNYEEERAKQDLFDDTLPECYVQAANLLEQDDGPLARLIDYIHDTGTLLVQEGIYNDKNFATIIPCRGHLNTDYFELSIRKDTDYVAASLVSLGTQVNNLVTSEKEALKLTGGILVYCNDRLLQTLITVMNDAKKPGVRRL